jgi:DNA-directed RNA polymerase specialized sigma24 family protein
MVTEGTAVSGDRSAGFELFARVARPRLVRALAPVRGEEAADGAAEALAYAWEHWDRVGAMANPIGYLYRVGQSRTRRRRPPALPSPETIGLPDVEPALIPALLRLPDTQRLAVWLVHACQWRYGEVAEALNTTTSMVGNHVSRGLARLRQQLEVHSSA